MFSPADETDNEYHRKLMCEVHTMHEKITFINDELSKHIKLLHNINDIPQNIFDEFARKIHAEIETKLDFFKEEFGKELSNLSAAINTQIQSLKQQINNESKTRIEQDQALENTLNSFADELKMMRDGIATELKQLNQNFQQSYGLKDMIGNSFLVVPEKKIEEYKVQFGDLLQANSDKQNALQNTVDQMSKQIVSIKNVTTSNDGKINAVLKNFHSYVKASNENIAVEKQAQKDMFTFILERYSGQDSHTHELCDIESNLQLLLQ